MRSRAEILIKETTTSKHTFDVAQTKLPRLTGEGRGEVATRSADCHPELDSGSINAGRETFKAVGCIVMHQLTSPPDGGARGGSTRRETAHPFNILFSSPSLVLEFKTEPNSTKNLPAQGFRKQYIEQENNLPLSKGEDAVVLAQASYKCGVRVQPVGFQSVSEANKTIFHFPLSIFHSREVNYAKH